MIAIYSNTGMWGGVDVLIARFAAYLRAHEIDFCIIENEGSRLRSEVHWAKFFSLLEVNKISRELTHVFVPSVNKLRDNCFPWMAFSYAKILTMVVHPNDVFRHFYPNSTILMGLLGYFPVKALRLCFRGHTKIFDELFHKLIDEAGLVVMDGATLRTTKFYLPHLSTVPAIVPIPSYAHESETTRRSSDGPLSIGYLGRMDGMKWSAIEPFIKTTLAKIAKSRETCIHVISEGSYLGRFEALCGKLNIKFIGYGYLPNRQALEVIISNTDLAVAMGTSALDIAGVGHPCVIIDPCVGKFCRRQSRFRFVDETNDFTLGEYRDFPYYVEGRHSFSEVIHSDLRSAGLRGLDYVYNNHDPNRCFELLLCGINKSRLSVSELEPFVQRLEKSFVATKLR